MSNALVTLKNRTVPNKKCLRHFNSPDPLNQLEGSGISFFILLSPVSPRKAKTRIKPAITKQQRKKTPTVNSEPCECPKTKGIMMDGFSCCPYLYCSRYCEPNKLVRKKTPAINFEPRRCPK